MWATIGKWLLKGALWAVENPQVIQNLLTVAQANAAKTGTTCPPRVDPPGPPPGTVA